MLWKWLKEAVLGRQKSPDVDDNPWTQRTPHDHTVPLGKDERDVYDTEYGILKQDRDEWRRRAEYLHGRYVTLRDVVDQYASPANWAAVQLSPTRRLWIREEHGYRLAREWIIENVEKETR